MIQRRILRGTFTLLAVVAPAVSAQGQQLPGRWSAERAMAWERETGWLVGSNYAPQTAINQLDMWQRSRGTRGRSTASWAGRRGWG